MSQHLINDALTHKNLFVGSGSIDRKDIADWLDANKLSLPQDLLNVWERLGTLDMFESEMILSPFGDKKLGDEILTANKVHRNYGMNGNFFIFHIGMSISAVDLKTQKYVVLDNNYKVTKYFSSLDEWYLEEIKEEYAKRYFSE